MISPLKNRTFRRLYTAQVIALAGTGLATVALGLLAYDLAGTDAGMVLGTALAIKMIAYVGVAPIANAFVDRLPRRLFLVVMDLVRAIIALVLPFVDQVWQIYLLIFVLQAASAAFTPAFQAAIPDVLPEEAEYTKALSLSRLAYDLESLLSPTVAAALLTVISFHWLFGGTALGFAASAAILVSTAVPQPRAVEHHRNVYDRTTRGVRIYLATPRLRGLLALSLSVAAGGAMVIVNTVVYVQGVFGRPESDVALALALFGGGSMTVALVLPLLLGRIESRPVMLGGAVLMAATLLLLGWRAAGEGVDWYALLAGWFALGFGYSAVLTPSARLLRRSADQRDRPALFAAQFALSHACWLLTYPLAGWLATDGQMTSAFLVMGGLTVAGALATPLLWPTDDPQAVEHFHNDLPADHPHVRNAERTTKGLRHAHDFVIDDVHREWPG